MKIIVESGSNLKLQHQMAVFFISEDNETKELERLDRITKGIAADLHSKKLLSTKHGSVFVSPTFGKMSSGLVAFVGLGNTNELTFEKVRLIGGVITAEAKKHKVASFAVDCDALKLVSSDTKQVVAALTEGLVLANYEYKEYKSEPKKDEERVVAITKVILVVDTVSSEITQAVGSVQKACQAVCFARDLVNHPPAQLHPKTLKEAAEKIAASSGGAITIKSYGRAELTKMGAGAILGVAQGSEFEPFLVHMEYHPKNTKKAIALVGKGVTFDSGGLSLKPSEGMEDMKMDMAGAATVLGVFEALKNAKPIVHIHGIFATVENMPSDRALRIGDILKTLSGKTVEVLNTDAEGRLILADALYYAEQQEPDYIIDFATLTGACMVALGHQIAGLFTKNDELSNAFLELSKDTGEKLCHLPLTEEYNEELKSDIADMQNIGAGRYGGAITAALFLQRFIKDTPWAHWDIAGPAFCRKACNSYTPAGGTGFGVRTVLKWLLQF